MYVLVQNLNVDDICVGQLKEAHFVGSLGTTLLSPNQFLFISISESSLTDLSINCDLPSSAGDIKVSKFQQPSRTRN